MEFGYKAQVVDDDGVIRISYLKRTYGWDPPHLRGYDSSKIWCGHGVLAHNPPRSEH